MRATKQTGTNAGDNLADLVASSIREILEPYRAKIDKEHEKLVEENESLKKENTRLTKEKEELYNKLSATVDKYVH